MPKKGFDHVFINPSFNGAGDAPAVAQEARRGAGERESCRRADGLFKQFCS